MASIDEFLRAVQPSAPLAPVNVIRYAIVVGAKEFCDATKLVQYTSVEQPIVAGQDEYSLLDEGCDTEDLMLARLLWATLDGEDIFARVDGGVPVTSSRVQATGGTDFLVREDGTIKFLQTPTESGAVLIAHVALTPRYTATTLPDLLRNRYMEAVAAAARVYLHKMEAPWATEKGLEMANNDYLRLLRDAKNEFWDSHATDDHILRPGRPW